MLELFISTSGEYISETSRKERAGQLKRKNTSDLFCKIITLNEI